MGEREYSLTNQCEAHWHELPQWISIKIASRTRKRYDDGHSIEFVLLFIRILLVSNYRYKWMRVKKWEQEPTENNQKQKNPQKMVKERKKEREWNSHFSGLQSMFDIIYLYAVNESSLHSSLL